VLVCLVAHTGHVVTKQHLLRNVWPDTFVTDDVLTRAISELRRVFGDDVKEPRIIQTIPKSGYRLIAGVDFGGSPRVGAAPAQTGAVPTTRLGKSWRRCAARGGASDARPRRSVAERAELGYPAVSSCASRLAYVHEWMDANIWRIEIRHPARSVSSPTKLIASTRHEAGPQFSPDGKRIAFHSNRSGSVEIWVYDADGRHPLQLTSLGSHSGTPRWSPRRVTITMAWH
jgi:WD40-like Beta Propeller Repeat